MSMIIRLWLKRPYKRYAASSRDSNPSHVNTTKTQPVLVARMGELLE